MSELEQRSELVDDAVNKTRQLMEKWNNRLTIDSLVLPERYLNGDIEIIVRFRDSCSGEWEHCAIFQYEKVSGTGRHAGECGRSNRVDHLPRHPLECFVLLGDAATNNNSGQCDVRDQHQAMFVDTVKIMDRPEIVVASLVRLEGVDDCFRTRVNSLYFSRCMGFVFGRTLKEGKACLGARCLSMCFDKLPHQVIERAAQVVDCISDNKGNDGGDWREVDPMAFAASLRISLDSDLVQVSATSLKCDFELTDVIFGPFDFCPNAD